VASLNEYLQVVRPCLLRGQACADLFVTQRGQAMTRQAFWYLIKRYALQAGIGKPLSPHALAARFRYSSGRPWGGFAGSTVAVGHSDLSTTQI